MVLTIYLLYWLGISSEEVLGNALRYVLPKNTYFLGLGMFCGLMAVAVEMFRKSLFRCAGKCFSKSPAFPITTGMQDFFTREFLRALAVISAPIPSGSPRVIAILGFNF